MDKEKFLRKNKQVKSKQINLRLDKETYEKYKKIGKKYNISEFIRQQIIQFLSNVK